MIFGGVGALVVIVLLVVLNSGDKGAQAGANNNTKTPKTGSTAGGTSKPAPVAMGSAKAGKTPTVTPPPLTQADLQKFQGLLNEAKVLLNDGKRARMEKGDNQAARQKMGEASKLLAQAYASVEKALDWQADAQMEDWAQPSEYVTLEALYSRYSKYDNEARKGGG